MMDIIYSKCYNGVIMVGGFADVRKISVTQTTQNHDDLGITQNYLGNPMEGQTIQLLKTIQEITQITQANSAYLA